MIWSLSIKAGEIRAATYAQISARQCAGLQIGPHSTLRRERFFKAGPRARGVRPLMLFPKAILEAEWAADASRRNAVGSLLSSAVSVATTGERELRHQQRGSGNA